MYRGQAGKGGDDGGVTHFESVLRLFCSLRGVWVDSMERP